MLKQKLQSAVLRKLREKEKASSGTRLMAMYTSLGLLVLMAILVFNLRGKMEYMVETLEPARDTVYVEKRTYSCFKCGIVMASLDDGVHASCCGIEYKVKDGALWAQRAEE